jgi:hypothetical protein
LRRSIAFFKPVLLIPTAFAARFCEKPSVRISRVAVATLAALPFDGPVRTYDARFRTPT